MATAYVYKNTNRGRKQNAKMKAKNIVRETLWPTVALLLIIAGSLLLGEHYSARSLWMNYFVLHLMFTALALGIISLLSIHYLLDAKWSASFTALRHLPRRLISILMFSFLPLFLAFHILEPFNSYAHKWFHPAAIGVRSILIFIAYYLLAQKFDKLGESGKAVKLSVLSLIIIIISLSFFTTDWLLPLMMHTSIALLPFFLFTSFLQLALSLIFLMNNKNDFSDYNDNMGRYLLAVSLFWVYFIFSVMLIKWYAQLDWETVLINVWFGKTHLWLLIFVLCSNFIVPFLLLLPAHLRKQKKYMSFICRLIIIGKFAEFVFLTSAFMLEGKSLHLLSSLGFFVVFAWTLSLIIRKMKGKGDEK